MGRSKKWYSVQRAYRSISIVIIYSTKDLARLIDSMHACKKPKQADQGGVEPPTFVSLHVHVHLILFPHAAKTTPHPWGNWSCVLFGACFKKSLFVDRFNRFYFESIRISGPQKKLNRFHRTWTWRCMMQDMTRSIPKPKPEHRVNICAWGCMHIS